MNVRNPFEPLSINDFEKSLIKYSAVNKFFSYRMKRLIMRGKLTFFDLPRLYKWLIIGKDIAQKKLSAINTCLECLYSIEDSGLGARIRNLGKLESDKDIFNGITELIVISWFLRNEATDFVYEEFLGDKQPKLDINFSYEGKKIRVDVTHKEDEYKLADTAEILKANLLYAIPGCGGTITYAPPGGWATENKTGKCPEDMTENQLKETISNAIDLYKESKKRKLSVHCPSQYFFVELDTENNNWFIHSSGTWFSPDINGYLESMRKKVEKYEKINDNSYKVIAMDYIPGSDFHEDNYYRKKLIELAFSVTSPSKIRGIEKINEIVTFSTRFETGNLEAFNVLWKLDKKLDSIFRRIALRYSE